MNATLIAITGGIGAGKSVVCKMLSALGHPVYDCDSQAKAIMDNSTEIKRRIATEIAAEAIAGDTIRRDILASVVFNDPAKLQALNEIVHGHVREHIGRMASQTPHPVLFVETAILYESRLDEMVSQVWDVTAPVATRVNRIVARNSCTPGQALERINAQNLNPERPHHTIHRIINDDVTPVLPQVLRLLKLNSL